MSSSKPVYGFNFQQYTVLTACSAVQNLRLLSWGFLGYVNHAFFIWKNGFLVNFPGNSWINEVIRSVSNYSFVKKNVTSNVLWKPCVWYPRWMNVKSMYVMRSGSPGLPSIRATWIKPHNVGKHGYWNVYDASKYFHTSSRTLTLCPFLTHHTKKGGGREWRWCWWSSRYLRIHICKDQTRWLELITWRDILSRFEISALA